MKNVSKMRKKLRQRRYRGGVRRKTEGDKQEKRERERERER